MVHFGRANELTPLGRLHLPRVEEVRRERVVASTQTESPNPLFAVSTEAYRLFARVLCADAMSVGDVNNGVMKGEEADGVKKKELGRGTGRRVLGGG